MNVATNASHIANLNPLRYRSYFYDAETGWYWLNTRYYNPVVGRFINADGLLSTGQGVLGHNMFAYCLNNPVCHFDESGMDCICLHQRVGPFHKCNSQKEKKPQTILDQMRNKDGTYSLYDNRRHDPWNRFHEQILSFSTSLLPSPDYRETQKFGLGSVSVDVYTGGWEGENYDLSLFDVGHAEAALEIDNGEFKCGAFASAWSPSFSLEFGDFRIEFGAEVGAIGIGTKASMNKIEARVALIFGVLIRVEKSN